MNEQNDSQVACPFCRQATGFVRVVRVESQMKFMTYVCRTCDLKWEISEPYYDRLRGIRAADRRDENET